VTSTKTEGIMPATRRVPARPRLCLQSTPRVYAIGAQGVGWARTATQTSFVGRSVLRSRVFLPGEDASACSGPGRPPTGPRILLPRAPMERHTGP
jgi:hypothetical protein